MNKFYLAHELIEWFNCPRKAYHLHTQGCTSLIQASTLREHMRVITSFLETYIYKSPPLIITEPTLEKSIDTSLTAIQEKKHRHISQAVVSFKHIVVFIPYLYWNNNAQGWCLYLPTSTPGLRNDHLHLATLLYIVCQNNNIPIAKIMLTYYKKNNHSHEEWFPSDITNKTIKHQSKIAPLLDELFTLIQSSDAYNESCWKSCNKQYCDVCCVEKNHQINDIRTLRKAKEFQELLQEKHIQHIIDIPKDIIPNSSVINRQIDAVTSDTSIFIQEEIKIFLDKLKFPRYYLDFEAFSTAIPYPYEFPYTATPGTYTPFLFSLQKQEQPYGAIHTQLWAMIPGKNQIRQMWDTLKQLLSEAGSIVVYDSQFEQDMIQKLSTTLSENQKGNQILEKIVDLQEIFFNLSLYHPEQKGKISLKTIVPIWIQGDYSTFKVNEGIGANYYYTALTDKTLEIFSSTQHIPYIAQIFTHIALIEKTITLKDIAQYCKYDTEVMIKLVDTIEQRYHSVSEKESH